MKGKKTGGREKGTANKTTTIQKELITGLLSNYAASGQMGSDFEALEPKDRISIAEKLMQYCMPKMQSAKIDTNIQNEGVSLEVRLAKLAKGEEV